MPVEKNDTPIINRFLDTGLFTTSASFGSVTNQRPPDKPNELYFPSVPPEQEDVVWQTWVPLEKEADFIELQIWYPRDVVTADIEDKGYLYQIEVNRHGETAIDGLLRVQLEVKALTRAWASKLELPS